MNKFSNQQIFIIIILIITLAYGQQQECFLLMVGKDASVNGHVFLAHNNDLSGDEASMLTKVHASQKIDYLPDNRLSFGKTYDMLILQTNIGFSEGDAVGINEKGVAVAGGLSMKNDRNSRIKQIDPLISGGLGGGVRYFALQHAETARECVQIIGKCYDEYGVGYPSGVGVADTNEIWYLETGGGKSWAAVKIPNDHYFVGANSYRIGEINLADTVNFIYSENLRNFAKDNKINFQKTFGGGVKEKDGNNLYNTRRIWRAMSLLNPKMNIENDTAFFPLSYNPREKISLEQSFAILRDYYTGTEFSMYKSGKFNDNERAIACWRGVHTDVIALVPGKPVDFGAVLWTGLSTPFTSIYVPFYFGVEKIYEPYTFAPDSFHYDSAFWQYKKMGDMTKLNFYTEMQDWVNWRIDFERKEIENLKSVSKKLDNLSLKERQKVLEKVSRDHAVEALSVVKKMIEEIEPR